MFACSPSTDSAPARSRKPRRGLGLLLALSCGLSLLTGCPTQSPRPADDPAGKLPEGAALSLLVVDDPALAEAAEQLAGEWKGLTGSELRVRRVPYDELAAGDPLDADALVCPACQIGDVAALVDPLPVPERLIEQPAWADVFTLLRIREAVWGSDVLGVPLGSPVLVVYYRPDLLEKLDLAPPQTWAEYQEAAERLSDREALGDALPPGDHWHGTLEPLGPGWAAVVLLARAAPYVRHRENYSTLFRVDTMEPLIDGPPYVRALEELVRAASHASPEPLTCDPAAVRSAFWQGRCAMALTWPTAAAEPPGEADSAQDELPVPGEVSPDEDVPVALAELPGSPESYDVAENQWEPREEESPHVPLLGTAGRIGLVPGGAKWPEAAFRLLFWLSDEQSVRLSAASPAATLFRSDHLESPKSWVEPPMPPAAAARYAELTQQTLCRPPYMFALRIPGRRQYLAALDEAVRRAVRGEQTPEESLRQTADAWRRITDRLGPDRQRDAYWQSLGLE